MKAQGPKIVLRMEDWLPPYGENSVRIETRDADLVLKVTCDSPDRFPIEFIR